jgi:DNA mismatch repair protein MutL
VAEELESYGFELMRLSGRTVAIKSTPADLPASEARNVLAEVLDTVDSEKRGAARASLRDEIAASLACHAAIKVNMPLAPEKMRWLIDRLLTTSSPPPVRTDAGDSAPGDAGYLEGLSPNLCRG